MDDKEMTPALKISGDLFDINGHSFNPDMFLQKILKEYSLKQVMDQESEIVHDTQALHSDMQTLVYENYNKFISATDTVRKMKNDFKKMEEEMDLLCNQMDSITSFSEQISSTLQDSREKITKLSGVHTLLRRLQFLFRLPNKLKAQMQEGNYAQAIQDYLDTQRVLEQYGNLESFQGIQRDCSLILQQLKQQLCENFKSKESTAKELAASVDLLLQLGEPADSLSAEFLAQAGLRLTHQLAVLRDQAVQDLIEFVDLGSNGFLSDLCFVASSYSDMFINRTPCNEELSAVKLNLFVLEHTRQYFELVLHRIEEEEGGGDTGVLVRALDRFLRRLAAVNALFTNTDFALAGLDIVIQAGRRQCKWHLICLKTHLSEWVTRIRGSLATPRSGTEGETPQTAELVTALVMATVEKIKGVLQDLLLFLQPDLVFATKPQFVESFNVESVREGLVVCFLHHLTATVRSFTSPASPLPALPLLLVLAKMCLEFQATNVHYLLNVIDDWFSIEQHQRDRLTSESELCINMGAAAQHVLNHYVRMQGLAISQMLRKSVETRDWMHSLEPRTVRAVMKRVMEEMTAVETQVGVLFEEGSRAERSSDSSHKTQSRHHRSTWSNFGTNSHHSLAATHINRIFNERVEIFAPVEFSKVSILTGIIKISLKTLLECVRLRTFSKYGLQQIQVDTHYLQLYLWRYVADENLVHFLLDEVLGSAVHRCLDPVLMEPGIVEIICERG